MESGRQSKSKLQISSPAAKTDDGALAKLQQELENLAASTHKTLRDHQFQIDDKASKQDLLDLESRLREMIAELAKGMQNDDTSALRKKLG